LGEQRNSAHDQLHSPVNKSEAGRAPGMLRRAYLGHGYLAGDLFRRKQRNRKVACWPPKRPFRLCDFRTSIMLRSYARRVPAYSESGVLDCSLHGFK